MCKMVVGKLYTFSINLGSTKYECIYADEKGALIRSETGKTGWYDHEQLVSARLYTPPVVHKRTVYVYKNSFGDDETVRFKLGDLKIAGTRLLAEIPIEYVEDKNEL